MHEMIFESDWCDSVIKLITCTQCIFFKFILQGNKMFDPKCLKIFYFVRLIFIFKLNNLKVIFKYLLSKTIWKQPSLFFQRFIISIINQFNRLDIGAFFLLLHSAPVEWNFWSSVLVRKMGKRPFRFPSSLKCHLRGTSVFRAHA